MIIDLRERQKNNDEAIAAWDGPLFERWMQLAEVNLRWLQQFSERAFELVKAAWEAAG